jgi:heat shock protein HspQ
MQTDTPNKTGPYVLARKTSVTTSGNYRVKTSSAVVMDMDRRFDTQEEAIEAAKDVARSRKDKPVLVVKIAAAVSVQPVYETHVDITGEGS